MKKVLRELTTELQTLCHEGYSDHDLKVHINGKSYDVQKAFVGIEKDVVLVLVEVDE